MITEKSKMMNPSRYLTLRTAAFLIVLLGCDSFTEPTATLTLSLTSQYTTELLAAGMAFPKSAVVSAVDSIQITQARIVIRNVKFKTSADSMNFKTTPVLMELNLAAIPNELAVAQVPPGTYRKIKFKIHRLENSDLSGMSDSEQLLFSDFLDGERYSTIIDGTVFQSGLAPASFTYRSRLDAEQEFDLDPNLLITESTSSTNVTLKVSSAEWFSSKTGGLLDPTDPSNDSEIDGNIKKSFKAYKDDDKDGRED